MAEVSTAVSSVGWWAKSSATVTPSNLPSTSKRRCTPVNFPRVEQITSGATPRQWAAAAAATAFIMLCSPGTLRFTRPSCSP